MTNQIQPIDAVRNDLQKMQPQFKAALPSHVSVEKFQRVLVTAVQQNPALLNADRRSLYASSMKAAQMGLLPDGREGAIVTFKDQAQFMPMIGGVMKLVRNSGELASIDAQIVYSKDKFTYRPGLDAVPMHEPDWFGERGDVIGVYAVARMKDGATYVEIMNRQQVDKVRNVSRAKDSGPWVTWWDEMARKTAIRRLAKRLPLSTDLDGVLAEDDPLFMPPEQPAPMHDVSPQPEAAPRKRNSNLQKVVDAEPVEEAPPPAEEYDMPQQTEDDFQHPI